MCSSAVPGAWEIITPMCGRFALARCADELTSVFALAECADLSPRFNITPGTDIPVIRRSPAGLLVLQRLRWGLVPHWSHDQSIGKRLINARAATVADKPSFRAGFQKRRCLIPADGFYEWDHQGQTKQPYYYRHAQGEVLAFGGLWESWQAPDGSLLRTTTIITTDANAEVAPIHDRMPLILNRNDYHSWLEGEVNQAVSLLQPAPTGTLRSWSVSRRVNRVAAEGPELIFPDHS